MCLHEFNVEQYHRQNSFVQPHPNHIVENPHPSKPNGYCERNRAINRVRFHTNFTTHAIARAYTFVDTQSNVCLLCVAPGDTCDASYASRRTGARTAVSTHSSRGCCDRHPMHKGRRRRWHARVRVPCACPLNRPWRMMM